MAEGKKSFVLYVDQQESWEDLTDQEAGQLIKHIFKYVNDQQPEPPTDRVIKATWKPIQTTLKRDLKKFKERAERSRQNGALGGRPANPNKPTKPNGLINNPEEPTKPDSDSDSVSDSVSDIKDITPEAQIFNLRLDLSKIETELLNSQSWKEQTVIATRKQTGLNLNNINPAIKHFIAELKAKGETARTLNATKSYFINWIKQNHVLAVAPAATVRKRKQL